MNHREIIKSMLYAALSGALGTIVAVKTNEHIEKFTKDCQGDKKKHKTCFLYLNPYIVNLALFVLTFITTFILYLVLFYIFGLKN